MPFCIMVSLLYFDIWGDLIAFEDALGLIRTEQQSYTPAVLSRASWKVEEKVVCCLVTLFT